ncbi:MAG: YgfZ/GcvT domain-containing protein [Pikeienuella sp.]
MTLSMFTDPSRAVLRITGKDARPLLQDLVTNNLDRVTPTALVYAALLTPQGKFLFDFFITEDAEGALLFDVAADRAPALAQRLSMYRLRREMDISPTTLAVSLIWGGETPPDGALPDPRCAAMGWRLYGDPVEATSDRAAYDALRVAHLVPDTGTELLTDETYILEAGFERLNGVDFRKGCYVGQEVTARMKHKTVLKKGIARVSVEGAASAGTAIEVNGKPAGQLHTVAGGEALAHLRFDRAEGDMQAGDATLRRIA